MPGRAHRILSMALSLGILCALAYQFAFDPAQRPRPVDPEPPKNAVQSKSSGTPPPVAAIRLPPPPARQTTSPVTPLKPRQKVVAVSPLKAKPAKKPVPVRRKRRPALKPVPPPPFEAAKTPAPQHISQTAAGTIAPDAAAATEGRTLLRMLEHGSGPAIEIAWPSSARARERLYRHFGACFGLRVAVLAGEDRLYVAGGTPGAPWRLNLDAFSGFMRQHDVSASREETRELRRIVDFHRLPARSAAVRIFPRHVDAVLLGGLQQIVGEGYAAHKTIQARYSLRRGRIFVDGILADGRKLPGRIDLSPAARATCRGRMPA